MEFRSNKKDTKYEWEMWWTELEEDHKGIRWKNDHHFWTDWVKPYIESIIREPERNIPWKWGLCKAPIISKYCLIQFVLKAVLNFIILELILMRADNHIY